MEIRWSYDLIYAMDGDNDGIVLVASGFWGQFQGTLPAGPVTLLRIGGKAMDRLWLAEGDLLRSGDAENLCRTQAEIQLTRGGNVTDLLRAPLGNHLVLVPGHHLDRLQSWWETML